MFVALSLSDNGDAKHSAPNADSLEIAEYPQPYRGREILPNDLHPGGSIHWESLMSIKFNTPFDLAASTPGVDEENVEVLKLRCLQREAIASLGVVRREEDVRHFVVVYDMTAGRVVPSEVWLDGELRVVARPGSEITLLRREAARHFNDAVMFGFPKRLPELFQRTDLRPEVLEEVVQLCRERIEIFEAEQNDALSMREAETLREIVADYERRTGR